MPQLKPNESFLRYRPAPGQWADSDAFLMRFFVTTREAPVGSTLVLLITGRDADSRNDVRRVRVNLSY